VARGIALQLNVVSVVSRWSLAQSCLLGLSMMVITGQNIRKLVKDGFIIRQPHNIHSRSRARRSAEAKAKGRHSGYGAHAIKVLLTSKWIDCQAPGR
jgi:hypothetical protein